MQFVRRCYGLPGIYGRFDSKIRFEIESDGRFDSRFDSNAKNDSQVPKKYRTWTRKVNSPVYSAPHCILYDHLVCQFDLSSQNTHRTLTVMVI